MWKLSFYSLIYLFLLNGSISLSPREPEWIPACTWHDAHHTPDKWSNKKELKITKMRLFSPAILEARRLFQKKSFLAALLQWTLEFKGEGFARSPLLLLKEKHYLLLKIGGTTVVGEEIRAHVRDLPRWATSSILGKRQSIYIYNGIGNTQVLSLMEQLVSVRGRRKMSHLAGQSEDPQAIF